MSKPVLSQRDGIDILDRAMVLSARHFRAFVAIAILPSALLLAGLRVWAHLGLPFQIRLAGGLAAYGFLGVTHAVIDLAAWDFAHGRALDVTGLLRRMRRRGLSVFLGYILKVILGAIGLILLVFPGLYLLAYWFGIPVVNVLEDLDLAPSIRRSMHLAKGAYPGIITSTGFAYIIFFIASYGGGVALRAATIRPGSPAYLAAALLLQLTTIPFRGATGTLLYLELRKRTEGYELEGMLAALPDAASTPEGPRTTPTV